MTLSQKKFLFSFCGMIFLASFLLFFRLGDRSFRNPDEGRYAEIAREMALEGHWDRPMLYGVDYLRKPPFFYWLVALSFKSFGFDEMAARAVPAFFALLGILAVFFFACRVFDLETAFFSSIFLCTNVWYVSVGRYLLIDMVFSFFITASIFLFYLGLTEKKHKTLYTVLFYAALAFAFLTKGLAAPVLVGSACLFYLVWTKKWKAYFLEMSWSWGLLIFMTIALPWFFLMEKTKPGFLGFFFFHEHVQRFIAPDFEHQEPWFYYLWVMPAVCLPWVLFPKPMANAFSFLKRKKTGSPEFFLFIASGAVVLFYSLSRSKLPTYILPSIPMLGILIARGWKETGQKKRLFCLPAVFGIGAILFLILAMERVNADYTTRPFAESLKKSLRKGDDVFIYEHPGAFYDFAFYLDHPVRVVGLEGEFELSRQDAQAMAVTVSKERFFSMLKEKKSFYCILRKSDFMGLDAGLRGNLRVIRQDDRKVLFESGVMG